MIGRDLDTDPFPFRGPGRAGVRETLLVAEDEAVMRSLLAETLIGEHYRVLMAGDGEEALVRSESHPGPIHLLVTDLMMPVMNGKELADRLCALRPEIKVLFITGYPRREALSENACDAQAGLLLKPFSGSRLIRKVRSVLDAPVEKR